ncbi:hypothetical protein OPV22_033895 [Ensete ventricosum]|uniref:RING-CH-type domain-containing protein n=1 Tax=Ensete ventricosum TaxID=4639 RepID=A0AAV8PVH0_ENSVE|nr:hypothetical protein OPV22_033895 [Ensete ventricosum]
MATTASPASPRSCTWWQKFVIVDPVVDIITVHYKCVKLWIKMKPRCPAEDGDLEVWRGAGRDAPVRPFRLLQHHRPQLLLEARDLPWARLPSSFCTV